MAAPTNVRVEAESISTTRLRWTYGGSAAISVYRSTDGSSYSEITDGSTRLPVGTTEFEDLDLDEGVKYWYKLSDDTGSTFSSVVTVITQLCGITPGSLGSDLALPSAGDEVSPDIFNDAMRRIEEGLTRFISPDGRTCDACITDGALVIDCINYDGCDSVEILVDQDINSISLPNCADREIDLNFIIPPNTTRGIGGWPRGIGFTGDEGYRAPISGGSSGRTINEFVNRALNVNSKSGKSKSGNSTQGSNSGGNSRTTGTGCTCTPTSDGGMRIVACNPDGSANRSNSLNCSASNKGAKLLVCGGVGPYTWDKTGSITLDKTTGGQITVSPPTNSGSGVAGNAYVKYGGLCDSGGGAPVNCSGAVWLRVFRSIYNCNDQLTTACGSVGTFAAANSCVSAPVNLGSNVCASVSPCHDGGNCNNGTCDNRSALMISGGCNPCGIQAGATVTVTDSTGTAVTIILKS